MNIFISGDAGFVGSHFRKFCSEAGHRVRGCDIKHNENVMDWFGTATGIDLFIHCAANVGGRLAIDKSPLWVAANLAIDQAAFDWVARTQTPMLYFSSSAAYPVWMQEGDPDRILDESDITLLPTMGTPDSTYGWSKLTGEYMANIVKATGVPVYVVRPFSGYGSDQSSDYPFGAFRDRVVSGEDPFQIWSDGTQKRDWIHIDDIIAACMKIVEADYRHPVNLATGRGVSFVQLAEMFGAKNVELLVDKPRGCSYRVGSSDLMRQFHIPQISIEQGIERALRENQ